MNRHKQKVDLQVIGEKAKIYRIKNLKIEQSQVAKDLQVSQNLISMFEMGKTDSAYILAYYVERGLVL